MFARTVALGVGLLSGVATSQLPEFLQQYGQRVGGAIDGLRPIIRSLDDEAQALGIKREEFVARLATQANPVWKRQSEVMSQASERYDRLRRTYDNWPSMGLFGRLQAFASDSDAELAQNAWRDYEPAIPTTTDGALTAGSGFLVGLLIAFGFIKTAGGTARRVRRLSSAALASRR